MTVDEANTKLAVASNIDARIAAYRALSVAACDEIARLELRHAKDDSDAYQLITRLIETRNLLTMATQHIEQHQGQHRAIDELDQAMVHITLAIESL